MCFGMQTHKQGIQTHACDVKPMPGYVLVLPHVHARVFILATQQLHGLTALECKKRTHVHAGFMALS